MGLDQSIFTTSKAIAKAIYEGNTPNGKWSTACLSPRNLEGKNEWTGFDTYAQSRLVQWGEEEETEIGIPGLENLGFTLTVQEDTVSEERRAKTLDVIKGLATIGECTIGLAGIDVNLYQVGLFRKFDILHVVVQSFYDQEMSESDSLIPLNITQFSFIRDLCQSALGKKDDYGWEEWQVSQLEDCSDFIDTILAFPDAEDAWFFYNPWW